MRINIPEEISKLGEIFAPFLQLDIEKKQYVLTDNAPEEAINAKRVYSDWFAKNTTRQ
jgi:hypothetical protein